MSLNIYNQPIDLSPVSKASSFTNPFIVSFDGRIGGIKEKKLYLRNNNSLHYYTDITLTLDDSSLVNHIDSVDEKFQWKLFAGDTKPTKNEWDAISAANTISFSDLGESGSADTSTYLPFWVYVKVPANLSIQNIKTISFVLQADESLV